MVNGSIIINFKTKLICWIQTIYVNSKNITWIEKYKDLIQKFKEKNVITEI